MMNGFMRNGGDFSRATPRHERVVRRLVVRQAASAAIGNEVAAADAAVTGPPVRTRILTERFAAALERALPSP